jgi:hypothetical protein
VCPKWTRNATSRIVPHMPLARSSDTFGEVDQDVRPFWDRIPPTRAILSTSYWSKAY